MLKNKGKIYWNGKSSEDFGIVVSATPSLNRPAKKYDIYTVPGRNGVIIEQQDAYENTQKKYSIWFADKNDSSSQKTSRDISAWLYAPIGYARLEDDFELDVYRKAYFVGPIDIENHMQMYGMCDITFECRPERYIKQGEIWIDDPEIIMNPYAFSAKPFIKVEGSGTGTLTINNETITLTDITDYIYIDSERDRKSVV